VAAIIAIAGKGPLDDCALGKTIPAQQRITSRGETMYLAPPNITFPISFVNPDSPCVSGMPVEP
jgi:hypothetical protein